MGLQDYLDKIKSMIDSLKAMSTDLGLANTGDEYKIISELFTYKFLNDKLVYDFENREDKDEDFEEFVYFVVCFFICFNDMCVIINPKFSSY